MGAAVGGLLGFTTGMSAGISAAMLLVLPGIGQVVAMGFGAAALLGVAGAGAGSALGKTASGTTFVQPTHDETSLEDAACFRELLAAGRSLVVVRTSSPETAAFANEILNRLSIAIPERARSRLHITTRDVGDVAILEMMGKITLSEGSTKLRETLRELTNAGKLRVLLNLQHVEHVDSSGLGELVKSHTTLLRHGGELKLIAISKRLRNLLHTTKLDRVFDIEADEMTALKSFRASAGFQ